MVTGLATPTTPRGRCCLSSCRSKHQRAFGQCQGGWIQMWVWVWPALLYGPSVPTSGQLWVPESFS